MNLRILDIKNRGDFDKEHILLKADSNLELNHYLIVYTTSEGKDEISSGTKICFWFPPTKLTKGDYVRLYTKEGKINSFKNKGGTNTYDFYLYMDSHWFSKKVDVASLICITEWGTHFYSSS